MEGTDAAAVAQVLAGDRDAFRVLVERANVIRPASTFAKIRGKSCGARRQGPRLVRHGGSPIGGTAALLIYPDAKVVVAVLTNMTSAPIRLPDFEKIAEGFLK